MHETQNVKAKSKKLGASKKDLDKYSKKSVMKTKKHSLMSESSIIDAVNLTIEKKLKNVLEKGITNSNMFQSMVNNSTTNNTVDKVDKLETEIKTLKDEIVDKGNFTKRLETEVYCLRNMIDNSTTNNKIEGMSRSEFKSDYFQQDSRRLYGYDMSRISNPKDNEQILYLSEQIESLTTDNLLKDKQITEYEQQIEKVEAMVNSDYLTISEFNYQKKLDMREAEELKMKLHLLERKMERLNNHNKRKELENYD